MTKPIREWVYRLAFAGTTLAITMLGPEPASAQDLKTDVVRLFTPVGSGALGSTAVAISALEVSTAPLGTSTGGFTFAFDPTLRTWKRSASTFGPTFAERSLTTGRLKVNAGFNWLHASYSSLGGYNLQNGDFRPLTNIVGIPGASYSTVQMHWSSDTFVMFGHVGVTDDLDVGMAVPWARVTVDGTSSVFSSSGSQLPGNQGTLASTTYSGVGDIAIFGKYRFLRQAEGGLAGSVELRLPTGSLANGRGLDVTRTLVSGIWSKGGKISPHANVGYEFWSGEVPLAKDAQTNAVTVSAKNQVKYALGIELQPQPRLTVVVDLVGRNLLNGGELGYGPVTAQGASANALAVLNSGVHAVSLAPTIKWNVWGSVLVTGNVLVALSNNGMRANAIPVLGLDWAF